MSKITQAIEPRKYELVRDRIFSILMDEFAAQLAITSDNDLNVSFFIERDTPVNNTELSACVVSYASGAYGNKNQGGKDGEYQFWVDFYTNSKTKGDIPGDFLAKQKLQKIMGVGDAILEDPIYKTLGFTQPFIMRSMVGQSNIAPPQTDKDAISSSMGRLTFNVTAHESTRLTVAELIKGYDTEVRIDNTGQGYFYAGNSYYE